MSPHQRQTTLELDLSSTPASLQSNNFSPLGPSHSRKSSTRSIRSAATPRPQSSRDWSGDFSFGNDDPQAVSAVAFGSLADELAEVWDEDGEGEEVSSGIQAEEQQPRDGSSEDKMSHRFRHHDVNDSTSTSPVHFNSMEGSSDPLEPSFRPRTRQRITNPDGSDRGADTNHYSSEVVEGIPVSLDSRIAAIENLVQQAAEAHESETHAVFARVADSLKDLGSQTEVENSTTRHVLSLLLLPPPLPIPLFTDRMLIVYLRPVLQRPTQL